VHCFPISVDRGVLGVLEVSCDKPLADDDLGTAEGFLGLYRNYLSLLDYSERDTLTGMLNRKTFDENLGKILAGMTSQTETKPPAPPPAGRRQLLAGGGRRGSLQARQRPVWPPVRRRSAAAARAHHA
jgi:hypothetical protein